MTTAAALYLRQSLDATGEHLAIDRQREDCLRIISDRGWTVADEYVDNSVSASKKNGSRPAYERMVADFAAGRFTALVCWDLDRLTRQPRQLEDWIDAAEDRSLWLITANGEADLATDGGRMFARVKAAVARSEVDRKSKRQTRAAAQRAEHGKVPAGVRLTGYTVRGAVIEDEGKTVRDIFSRFASGDSLRGIAAWLEETGARGRNGARWPTSTVRTILTNPRYAGRAVYRGKVTGHTGSWDAIVDGALFDTVQNMLTDPRRITNRVGTDRRWLGSGLYLCGVCGVRVRSHSGGRYRCPAGHITRIGTSIDEYVEAVIRDRLGRADLADLLAAPDDGRAQELSADLTRLRTRLDQIEADYDAGLIDGRRYAVASEKVRAEIDAANSARSRVVGRGLDVLTAADPVEAYSTAPLNVRRTLVDVLATVTLMQAQRGHKFDPDTVQIGWR